MNMTTVFGQFYQLLATVLLFVTDGHLIVLGGLLNTFDVLPLGGCRTSADSLTCCSRRSGSSS